MTKKYDYPDPKVAVVSDDDIAPFDPDHPLAMINMVPNKIREAILNLPPRYFRFTERELRKHCQPGPEEARLRINFWDEYQTAQIDKRKMKAENIIRGACSREYFYDVVMNDDSKFGYLIIPPVDYMLQNKDLLEKGWNRLREVLDMPFESEKAIPRKNGEFHILKTINTSLIREVREIVNMLDVRVKGAIVQKMLVKSQNVHHVTPPPADNLPMPQSMEQLEAMEAKIKNLQALTAEPETKDVVDGEIITDDSEGS